MLFGLGVVSGSLDVVSFLRLGAVFTSVMTSNVLFLGVAAVKGDGTLAVHSVVALAGFAVGTAVSERVTQRLDRDGRLGQRPVVSALTAELAVLAAVGLVWLATAGRPTGGARYAVLAAVALAMGMQSALSRNLPGSSVPTTYLTGMLTGAFSAVGAAPAHPRIDESMVVVICGVIAGAALSASILLLAPLLAPWAAFAILAVVLIIVAKA